MEKNRSHRNKWFRQLVLLGPILLTPLSHLQAAERIHTAYFSPAPGASSVIWVAKEARIFEKHGLDAAPVLIHTSVRALQAILTGESAIAESAGPAVASARLAGGEGYQGVLQEMAEANPKATALNVKDLVDARFVKELEDSGFISTLYKK